LTWALKTERALAGGKEAPKALRHVVGCIEVPGEPSVLQADTHSVRYVLTQSCFPFQMQPRPRNQILCCDKCETRKRTSVLLLYVERPLFVFFFAPATPNPMASAMPATPTRSSATHVATRACPVDLILPQEVIALMS